jgi:hypothetical protein
MKIPIILAALRQQAKNLTECIENTSACFEIHKGNVKEQLTLARSILASKDVLDRTEEQIRYIEIALGQLEKGIVEEVP